MMGRKNKYIPLEKRIVQIAGILDLQAQEPNLKYDPYMVGLYNGLEISLSLMEQREEVLKNCPSFYKYASITLRQKLKLKIRGLFGLNKARGMKRLS